MALLFAFCLSFCCLHFFNMQLKLNLREVDVYERSGHNRYKTFQRIFFSFQFVLKNFRRMKGRRVGDRFREHLRDVERNDKDASKLVTQHFNLSNHSSHHMTICDLSLH